ncbi:Vacuolar inheritance and morphology protein [Ophidiomyces ophidiicola]|nr:Vacuolar inheritance and morphology protein [Ophidiomyces ophidiicola]KAI1995411.1 Vacuolar inheritance and morphology protein [Ophidiomyces ophidiicola]KAI1997897.1 Vacuolar inheritance and morphology protein [Ophidiomyces ophidiicola]
MSSGNSNGQHGPDWEMSSPVVSTSRNGTHCQGPRSSYSPVVPSTRDLQSNGTTQAKHLPTVQTPLLSSTISAASSRETSPIRPGATTSRSFSIPRKNIQDSSHSRKSSTTSTGNTSAPIILDLEGNPIDSNASHALLPPTDAPTDPSLPVMPTKSGDPPLQWPRLNRLKSPPPNLPTRSPLQRTTSPKRLENDSIVANTSSKRYHAGTEEILSPDISIEASEDSQGRNTLRGSITRGTVPALETVQEGRVPRVTVSDLSPSEESGEVTKTTKSPGDSGSDSGNKSAGSKADVRKTIPSKPKPDEAVAKRSFTSLSSARGKTGETSMTNMTVETETVSSIPQVSLGVGAGERAGLGRKEGGPMIRLRPSDETIRPKKEKKKTRKLNLPAGTVSSKADIFEAKVASAVDDADSSDSAETFVYESNPPDPHPARQHRYHSRTPSTASMVGQLDQYGGRIRPGVRDLHGITGKRSMKFTNTSYNTMDGETEDRCLGRGSSRGNGHMHTARHYQMGRHGRNGVHQPFVDDPAFQSSHSPKSPRQLLGNGHNRNFKKDGDTYGYDFDAEGADDERTPLVGALRAARNRQGRRPYSAGLRQLDHSGSLRMGWCARYGVCAILFTLLFILTGGSTIFIFGATQPLRDLHVREIQNVLASEQTIMLDLDIEAINPNIFTLTISDMDVNIFAKSRFVGTDAFWRDHGPHPPSLPRTADSRKRAIMAGKINHRQENSTEVTTAGGVDKGTDPIPPEDDPSGDPQTMLLGRIFHFASPLVFDSSPWKHRPSNSTGQVRLTRPGNKTEEGGSLRWERVLQHPFELIVRGVVKYQLPLTSGTRSASVSSKISVLPDKGDDNDKDGDDDSDDSIHIE